MKLVEIEIDRHDWAQLRCACGQPASHVAADLLKMARADGESEIDAEVLEGHAWTSAALFEPALPAVSVALAALADDVSSVSRRIFSELLLLLLAGEGQATYLAHEGRDLIAECTVAAKSGIWLLYAEVISGRCVDTASNSYEALTLIEEDVDRLDRVQAAAAENLRWDLR
ncbi:hypothetical protein ACFW81_28735 [Streptomyces angustmyceticus]|uniref:hypothetical protein n=1 Tax=Streptomyces angustmyceticus TaxID=285578 RepID=UPI00369AEE23